MLSVHKCCPLQTPIWYTSLGRRWESCIPTERNREIPEKDVGVRVRFQLAQTMVNW